jgi:hypothetical protein
MNKKLFADLKESLQQHNEIIAGTRKPARVILHDMKPPAPKALPKPFPSKAPKGRLLTARTLSRRIAREDERADRHTAGLPPLKAPQGSSLKARKTAASK